MGPRFKNKRTRFIRIPVENPSLTSQLCPGPLAAIKSYMWIYISHCTDHSWFYSVTNVDEGIWSSPSDPRDQSRPLSIEMRWLWQAGTLQICTQMNQKGNRNRGGKRNKQWVERFGSSLAACGREGSFKTQRLLLLECNWFYLYSSNISGFVPLKRR